MKKLLGLLALSALSLIPALVSAQSAPLGNNPEGVTYYTDEQPFLNIFKTAEWFTGAPGVWDTGERDKIDVDANGYPKCLCGKNGQAVTFTTINALMERQGPPYYKAGQYIVLYDGEGTISYNFDAVKDTVNSRPGRDVLNVAAPNGGGIFMSISATDPNHTGNYIRNIRVVYAPYESLLASGEIFNPDFIARMAPFKALRFMDWQKTNSNPVSNWADRSKPTDVQWSTNKGVPAEIQIAVANKTNTDPWFNMPIRATDDYLTQFATLAKQQVGTNHKVYVELGNEVWNYAGAYWADMQYATQQGKLTWPTATIDDYWFAQSWYAKRVSEMCNLWYQAWGVDSSRVICVAATQAANPWLAENMLSSNSSSNLYGKPTTAKALAIAPYFGGNVGNDIAFEAKKAVLGPNVDANYDNMSATDKAAVDAYIASHYTVTDVINRLTPLLDSQTAAWTAGQKAVADKYGLQLVAYEGGQHLGGFVGWENSQPLTNLLISTNRDPRMGTLITQMLQKWQANGGGLFNYFVAISAASKWGSWGALESVLQTSSPKYDALVQYAGGNVPTLPPALPPPPPPTPTPTPTPTPSTTPVGPSGYTFCAYEGGTCSFSGSMSVAYGANNAFNYLTLSNGTACNNTVFGDPVVNTAKACFTKGTTVTPPPPPTTPPPPPPTPSPSTFGIGTKVKTTANLNVRAKANTKSGKILCIQPAGSLGTIKSGPATNQGYTWWNIDFNTGCDGWSVQSYLTTSIAYAPESQTASVGTTADELTALIEKLKAAIAQLQGR